MSNMSTPHTPTAQCMNCTEVCMNYISSWINKFLEPSKIINHVERYMILAAACLLIISFLGTWRRRSRNLVVQYGVKGVYLLSVPLFSYTMGLMQGVIKNELFPVWAVFLVFLFGGTNSASVQKLNENKQWAKLWFETILYGGYVGGVCAIFIAAPGTDAVYSTIRFGALLFMFYLLNEKNGERVTALVLASDHRDSGSLRVARHMTQLSNQPLSNPYDPRSMQEYRYMVFPFRADIPGVVTLDEIWCHGNNGVLSMEDHPGTCYLKDLCLSFALFRLTVRRYFGYSCPESGLDMTRDLILQGLLPRGEDDYGRAFQVIEVELAFLYDFFFTKYAAITFRGMKHFMALSLAVTVVIMVFGIYVLTHLNGNAKMPQNSGFVSSQGQDILVAKLAGFVSSQGQDILVTKLVLCTFVVFQLLQILLYCVSDWAKLSLIWKYLSSSGQTNTYIEKLLLLMGQASVFLEQRTWFRRWENKMGQYSFLDSFHYPEHQFLEKYSHFIPKFREGRKLGKSIPLPVEVKKAIARTLKDSNGQITNGASALQRHGMTGDLYWSCQTDGRINLAHVIMVWHIATSYCDISQVMNRTDAMPARLQTSRLVATSLSKYCAYLVAFVPELVPGNTLETENMLDDLVLEARGVFSTASDKCERLRQLQNQGIEGGMLAKGAILGSKLESIANQGTRWKLLADFWAELMLYIAPSHNVTGHIESLAQGGEFITHVWALLMHAGILERPAAGAA